MYRRPKFLEVLLEIRQEMSRQADYDVDLFAEMVRGGKFSSEADRFSLTDPKIEANSNGRSNKTGKSQI
jgi:hypothetical protein